MRKVAIEDVDVERSPLGVYSVWNPVSAAPGTDQLATNRFESEPGESFSGGLYTHHDQEVSYVQSGGATFDVADRPDSSATETATVGADEVIRVPPGSIRGGTMTRTTTTSPGSPSARPPTDASETPSSRCCTAASVATYCPSEPDTSPCRGRVFVVNGKGICSCI